MNDDNNEIPWDQRNLTRGQLCALENISRDTLLKLEKQGFGPSWTIFPGTVVERVTPVARAEWHARMNEWKASNAARLEAARKAKTETMSVLGKESTKSPRHPCNKGKKRVR